MAEAQRPEEGRVRQTGPWGETKPAGQGNSVGGYKRPLKVSDHEFTIVSICLAHLLHADEEKTIHQQLRFQERGHG